MSREQEYRQVAKHMSAAYSSGRSSGNHYEYMLCPTELHQLVMWAGDIGIAQHTDRKRINELASSVRAIKEKLDSQERVETSLEQRIFGMRAEYV